MRLRSIGERKAMLGELARFFYKPELYAPSSGPFWNDPHISEIMLDVHLDPDSDSSTRKHEFVDRSVKWITEIAPPSQYQSLLDLGCGPGIRGTFYDAGYAVTGIDLLTRAFARVNIGVIGG